MVNRSGFRKPYYAVHVFHNVAMSLITASDVWKSFRYFGSALSFPVNFDAVALCAALHLYHLWIYWRTFHMDDWLHHGLMIGVALPLGSLVPAGSLMGFSLFFTTGLPGAICYAALFARNNDWMSRDTEKRISRVVNLWMRAPGCVAHAALTLAATASAVGRATSWETTVGVVTAALTAWNGMYFLAAVMDSIRPQQQPQPQPQQQQN